MLTKNYDRRGWSSFFVFLISTLEDGNDDDAPKERISKNYGVVAFFLENFTKQAKVKEAKSENSI